MVSEEKMMVLNPPNDFICSNCACHLEDADGAVNEIHIYSVNNEFEKSVTILEALWEIFGTVKSSYPTMNMLQLAKRSEIMLVMCSRCAQVLSLLYKDFLTLIQISATGGYLGNLLRHIESWQNKCETEIITVLESDSLYSHSHHAITVEGQYHDPVLEAVDHEFISVSTPDPVPDYKHSDEAYKTKLPEVVAVTTVGHDENVPDSAPASPTVSETKPRVSRLLKSLKRKYLTSTPPSESHDSGESKKKYVKTLKRTTCELPGGARHFFRCSVCAKAFYHNWELYDHFLFVHEEKQRSSCSSCGWEYFPEIFQLTTHKCPTSNRTSDGTFSYPYRCTICDVIYEKDSLLKNHQDNAHVHDIIKFECVLCHKNCVRRSSLRQHYYLYHPETDEGDKDWPCSYCGMAFARDSEMWDHVASAHEKEREENPEKCNFCERRFPDYTRKAAHMRNLHGYRRKKPAQLNIPCDICGKVFLSMKRVRKHKAFKHGPEDAKKNQCNICAKKFWTKHKLQMHMRIHTQGTNANTRVPKEFAEYNLQYSCKYCPVTFTYKAHVDLHIRNFHSEKEMRCTCKTCGEKLNTNFELCLHKRTHMSKEERRAKPWNAIGEDGEFDCDICGKAYSSLKNLFTHHHYVHIGNENVTCDICQKALRARNLEYHNKVYHPEKYEETRKHQEELIGELEKNAGESLKCDICNNGKIYSKRSALLDHKSMHDGTHLKVSCPKCGVKVRNNTCLKRHDLSAHTDPSIAKPLLKIMKTVSNPRGKGREYGLACTICNNGKIYSSRSALLEHKAIHDGSHLKVTCPKCGEKVRSNTTLKLHDLRVHTDPKIAKPLLLKMKAKPKPKVPPSREELICTKCNNGKVYASIRTLQEHQMIHSGAHLKYSCSICGHKVRREFMLKRHMKINHPPHKIQKECSLPLRKKKSKRKIVIKSEAETESDSESELITRVVSPPASYTSLRKSQRQYKPSAVVVENRKTRTVHSPHEEIDFMSQFDKHSEMERRKRLEIRLTRIDRST